MSNKTPLFQASHAVALLVLAVETPIAIAVTPAPAVSISATPITVVSGSRAVISYSIDYATYCTASGEGRSASGPISGGKVTGMTSTSPLTADSAFSFTCTGPGGTASESVTVTVKAATGAVTTHDATLSWSAPTTNTNGAPVTPLSGYHVYYGNTSSALTQSVVVAGATATSFEITGLTAGTWYFAVAADAVDGTESIKSAIGSVTL